MSCISLMGRISLDRVSIGLLGVLLEVELTIIEQEVVVRMVDLIDEGGIFEDLRAAREDPLLVDEFNYFWFPGIQKIIKTTIAVSFGTNIRVYLLKYPTHDSLVALCRGSIQAGQRKRQSIHPKRSIRY